MPNKIQKRGTLPAVASASVLLIAATLIANTALADSAAGVIVLGIAVALVGIVLTFKKSKLPETRETRWRAAFYSTLVSMAVYIVIAVILSSREESGLLSIAMTLGGFVALPIYFGVSYIVAMMYIKD